MSTSFYNENEEVLKSNYPGLNIHIFNRFLDDLNSKGLGFSKIQNDLLNGKPLEYILNCAHFYSIELFVDENVLIPRQETELLFDFAKNEITKKNNPSVIDIGTGPGTIILALMKEVSSFKAFASDISKVALEIAKKNFQLLKPDLKVQNISLIESDRLVNINNTFDIIISNPPYIKEFSDKAGVHDKVNEFEPSLALYLKDEEYDQWFEDFFKDVYNKLNVDGVFLMEGHEDHLESQKSQAMSIGFSKVEILNDMTDRKRFLRMEK